MTKHRQLTIDGEEVPHPLPPVNLKTGEVSEPKVKCPHCAGNLQARFEAEQDLRGVERDLRRERRLVTQLRNELGRQQVDSPSNVKAEALFRYWIARCAKNSARTTFGDKRRKAVHARLREKDVNYIARAIDGLAASHYVSPEGKHYDDLELVCRDEVKLEGFYEAAERMNAPTLIGPAWHAEFGEENISP